MDTNGANDYVNICDKPPCYQPKCETCPYKDSCKNNHSLFPYPYIPYPNPWWQPWRVTWTYGDDPNAHITT